MLQKTSWQSRKLNRLKKMTQTQYIYVEPGDTILFYFYFFVSAILKTPSTKQKNAFID